MNKKTRNALLTAVTAVIAAVTGVLFARQGIVINDIYYATVSGTPDEWAYYDLADICHKGVVVTANYAVIDNACVKDSISHGIRVGNVASVLTNADGSITYTGTHHVTVQNAYLENTVLEGQGNSSGGWGSALKAEIGAHDIIFKDSKVVRCFGEGIGITGAKDVEVFNVEIQNCSKGNFYVDNSQNVSLHDNLAICNDPLYKRDGTYPPSYFAGTESYAPMGGKSYLRNLVVTNNISYGCQAFKYWGGYASPQGLEGGTITFNKFYNPVYKNIYIYPGTLNRDIVITPNEFLTSASVTVTPPPATLTPTRTPTLTPAPLTPTRTQTPTAAKTPTPTKTVTPTFTPSPVIVTVIPQPTMTLWCDPILDGTPVVCNRMP